MVFKATYLLNVWMDVADTWTDVRYWSKDLLNANLTSCSNPEADLMSSDVLISWMNKKNPNHSSDKAHFQSKSMFLFFLFLHKKHVVDTH